MSGQYTSHLSAAQIRAARALLNWSQDDLASRCGLSVNTIRKLELGHISPREHTTEVIRRTLEDYAIEFMGSDGVRHRPDDIIVYQGREGTVDFFNDVYDTVKTKGGEVVVVCPSDEPVSEVFGDYRHIHYQRMTALKDKVFVKCILTEDSKNLPGGDYCEYRYLSKHYVNSVPFYVYDNKYAVFIFNSDPSPKINVIQSYEVAEAFRLQFQSMWDKAIPLNTVERSSPNDLVKKKLARR